MGVGDIETQTRTVFANIDKSLRSVGARLGQIVKLTTFVTDVVRHPPIIRKVRSELFGYGCATSVYNGRSTSICASGYSRRD